MALPLGVSWLCLLVWGCICFVPQEGYNAAHGYKSPHTYNQFNHRESFKDNYEDETKAMRQNGFVLLQTKPVFYKNRHHVSPVGDLGEDMLQSQPHFVHKAGKFSLARADKGGNEVWSRWGANNQISDEHHSSPAAADFTSNLISSSVYGKQVLNPPSAPYPQHGLATRQLVSNYKTGAGPPSINDGIFISISKNKPVQSGYRQSQPIQFPLVSSGEEYSFRHHKVAHPNKHLHSPSQDFSYFSRKPKYTSHRKGSLVDQMSSGGFKHHKGLHREHQAYIPSQQNPPSSGAFSPRSQSFFANHVPKHRQKPAPSVPRKPQKQQDRSPLPHAVTSPSSSRGSHCSFIKYHKVDVDPSTLSALAGDEEKSQLHNQNLMSALQEPNDNSITKFRDGGSIWNGFASHGAKNHLNSLSADDRFLLQHGGYEDAVRAGLVKTTKQPMDLQIFQDNMNKRSTGLASWPSELLSEPKVSDSKCVVWRNTQSPLPKKSQKLSRSSVNAYIRSNRSARATAYLLKSCYTPYQRAHFKNGKHQWKLAVRQMPYPTKQKQFDKW